MFWQLFKSFTRCFISILSHWKGWMLQVLNTKGSEDYWWVWHVIKRTLLRHKSSTSLFVGLELICWFSSLALVSIAIHEFRRRDRFSFLNTLHIGTDDCLEASRWWIHFGCFPPPPMIEHSFYQALSKLEITSMERMQIQIHKVVVTHTHAQIHNTQKHTLLQTLGTCTILITTGWAILFLGEVWWRSNWGMWKMCEIVLESLVLGMLSSARFFPFSRHSQLLAFGTFVPITRGRSDDFPY